MNEPLPQTPNPHSLDRRAALVTIAVLQLTVLVLAPVICRENLGSPRFRNIAYMSLVLPWAMSVACMIGFACAVYPTHWARRLLIGCAACLWVWSALFYGHNLAGERRLSREIGAFWMLHLELLALFTAAIFFVLKRTLHLRLIVPGRRIEENNKSGQFHLRGLMSAIFLICVTLAVCRLAGPIELPTLRMVRFYDVLGMVIVALLGACSILAAFSRKHAVLFVFIFPSLVCLDVALILLMQLRVSQWAQYGPQFLRGLFIGHGIQAAICILTMLLIRWLG
jgi:hypothetical protein